MTIQHLVLDVGRVRLQSLHGRAGAFEFLGVQTNFDPAGAAVADILAGDLLHLRVQLGPGLRRRPGPLGVRRKIGALVLNPDEAEIAARGAKSDVSLVEHQSGQAASLQSISEGRTHQAAADNNRVMNTQGRVPPISVVESIQTIRCHVHVQRCLGHQSGQHTPGHGRTRESQVTVAEATEKAGMSRHRADVGNGIR